MKMTRFLIGGCLLVVFSLTACRDTDDGPTLAERCDDIIADLTRCYPDLALEGECTEATVAQYESYDLDAMECTTMDDMGKADVFAFGGCDEGQHVCAFIFCCDDYFITRFPSEADFDIVGLVDDYQSQLPPDVEEDVLYATRQELLSGLARTWEQDVVERPGTSPLSMAVELSLGLIEVPYDELIQAFRPQDWGVNLAFYLGGEVVVYEEDGLGRAVRQVERMVLSPFKIEADLRLGNMDMTKVEVIDHQTFSTKVYWRVYYSDNNSTETDVGSVEFIQFDETSTLVVFHSAHRLNAPGGIHISNDLVQLSLKTFFLDHIAHYATLVE